MDTVFAPWLDNPLARKALASAVAILVIVVLVQLVVMDTVGHLALALGVGIPMVIVHAAFQVRDDLEGLAVAGKKASPFVEKKGEKDLKVVGIVHWLIYMIIHFEEEKY